MWINRLNNYNNMLKINYLIIWISVKCTSTNALLDDYSFINYDLWHWQNSLIRYHTMHDRHTYNMLFGRWFTYNSLGDSILLAFPFFFLLNRNFVWWMSASLEFYQQCTWWWCCLTEKNRLLSLLLYRRWRLLSFELSPNNLDKLRRLFLQNRQCIRSSIAVRHTHTICQHQHTRIFPTCI